MIHFLTVIFKYYIYISIGNSDGYWKIRVFTKKEGVSRQEVSDQNLFVADKFDL